MSKLIKVTDVVGERLARAAEEDVTSLAGEIKHLLDIRERSTGSTSVRLDKMAAYLDGQFKKLYSLVEDTALDRLDNYAKKQLEGIVISYPWDNCVQDLYFDFPEDDSAWLPGVREMWGESSAMDMYNYIVKDGYLCSEAEGRTTPLLAFTPEVQAFLENKKNIVNTEGGR